MAFCVKCGNQVAEGAKFCLQCGTPVGGAAPAATEAARPEREKVGNIHKCPSCGAVIPSMTAKCPECGHEFRNVGVAMSISEFTKELNRLEQEGEVSERKTFITNYPIPNSREDLLEFAIVAKTQLELESKDASMSYTLDVWLAKADQILLKADLAFADDAASRERIKAMLSDTVETAKTNSNKAKKEFEEMRRKSKSGCLKLIAIPIIIIVVIWQAVTGWSLFKGIAQSVQGVGVTVSESAEIGPENIRITGSFDGYLVPAKTGLVMRPSDDGKTLDLTFEFTAAKNFQAALDAVIAKTKKDQGWEKDTVTVSLWQSKSNVKIGGITISGDETDFSGDDFKYFINTLANIEKGAAKTVKLSLPMSKRDMVPFMAKESIELFIMPVYELENTSKGILYTGSTQEFVSVE